MLGQSSVGNQQKGQHLCFGLHFFRSLIEFPLSACEYSRIPIGCLKLLIHAQGLLGTVGGIIAFYCCLPKEVML